MTLDIRPCEDRDVESLADLLHDMSVHYNGPDASAREVVREHLVDRILGPRSGVTVVVAMEGARAVGMAAISILYPAPKERGQLFMKELYVHADARDRGVGARLMAWVAAYAVSHDCSRLDWTAEAGNPGALRFYDALGARRVVEKVYYRLAGDELAAFAARG